MIGDCLFVLNRLAILFLSSNADNLCQSKLSNLFGFD